MVVLIRMAALTFSRLSADPDAADDQPNYYYGHIVGYSMRKAHGIRANRSWMVVYWNRVGHRSAAELHCIFFSLPSYMNTYEQILRSDFRKIGRKRIDGNDFEYTEVV